MKILHLGDLHIGKKVNDYSMIDNQKYVFEQIYECIENKKIKVVIIAGDIYDRSIPSEDAVELFDEFLIKLVNILKVKVIAVSGNHDSSSRLDFSSKILEKQGLYIQGEYKKLVNRVSIDDVDFYLMPFVKPETIRYRFINEIKNIEIKTFDDTMKFITDEIEKVMDRSRINVGIYHGLVIGSSEKEENIEKEESVKILSIGGKESVSENYFLKFDYTALGHLHSNRKVSSEKVRYCGSPIKYSFSEKNHTKSLTVITLKKEEFSYEIVPLKEKYPMIEVKGKLEEILAMDIPKDAYLKIILTENVLDAMNKLRSKYTQIMEMGIEIETCDAIELNLNSKKLKTIKPEELFKDFAKSVGVELDEIEKEKIQEIMNHIHGGL